MKNTIVLLSGGLDSATCLAIAKANGFAPIYTMAFDYGQRHRHELHAASALAKQASMIEHRVVPIDLRQFGGSALTADIAVPKDQIKDVTTARRADSPAVRPKDSPIGLPQDSPTSRLADPLPITYVPARNTIFLSYALAWSEVIDCNNVFIGVNALDYSGYPDCRPDYIAAFQTMARLGTQRTGFNIHAPLITLTKAQIIRLGTELGVDYSMTHSCYDPTPAGLACGHCDSCLLRKKGFVEAGVDDPTRYAQVV